MIARVPLGRADSVDPASLPSRVETPAVLSQLIAPPQISRVGETSAGLRIEGIAVAHSGRAARTAREMLALANQGTPPRAQRKADRNGGCSNPMEGIRFASACRSVCARSDSLLGLEIKPYCSVEDPFLRNPPSIELV